MDLIKLGGKERYNNYRIKKSIQTLLKKIRTHHAHTMLNYQKEKDIAFTVNLNA